MPKTAIFRIEVDFGSIKDLPPSDDHTLGRFTSWTMKSDHGGWLLPWSNSMVQLPWSNFLKIQFTNSLGPSLGVNRMWTKKNDHAPKSESADFF